MNSELESRKMWRRRQDFQQEYLIILLKKFIHTSRNAVGSIE